MTAYQHARIAAGKCVEYRCQRGIAPGSRSRCVPCLRKLRPYKRTRSDFNAWRPGGPGRPPAESKVPA